MGDWVTGLFDDFGFAGEGADFGGEGVEVMEAAVVAVGGHAGHVAHLVELPGGEDEQAAVGTGLEALPFGFPIGCYRLFLQVDERVAFLHAFVFHQQLPF